MHQQEATADKREAVRFALNKVNGLTENEDLFTAEEAIEFMQALGEAGYRVVRRSS